MKKEVKEFRDCIYSKAKEEQLNKRRQNYINNNNNNNLLSDNAIENAENNGLISNLIHPNQKNILSLADSFIGENQKNIDKLSNEIKDEISNIQIFSYNIFPKKECEINQVSIDIFNEIKNLRQQIAKIKSEIQNYKNKKNQFLLKQEQYKKEEETKLMKLKDQLDTIKFTRNKEECELNIIKNKHNEITNTLNNNKLLLQNLKTNNTKYINYKKYYDKATQILRKIHTDIQPYKNQMNNEYQEAKGNMRVFCRIRPPISKEIFYKQIDIEYNGENSMIIKSEIKASNVGREGIQRDFDQFQFNKIFKQNSSQKEIFEEISPLIQSSLNGFNINIFAYGQTGSGKTFTMEGDMSSEEKYGIIPRAVYTIFENYEKELKNMGWILKLSVKVCEIYNKKIRDLIGEKNVEKIDELKEIEIINMDNWKKIILLIEQRRKVAETKMNMESSRSHLIFKIKIFLKNNITNQEKNGSLNLIDLAGSERVDKNCVSEERFKESIEINSSLTHLKTVFLALKNMKDKFIPFHNTPLTDVLKDCLSGEKSKTLMFVNISPLLDSLKESTCSLKFATDVNKCYLRNEEYSDEDDEEINGDLLEE